MAQGSIIFRTHLGQAKYVLHCIFIYSILLITYIVMKKKTTRVSLVSFNKITSPDEKASQANAYNFFSLFTKDCIGTKQIWYSNLYIKELFRYLNY